MDQLATLKEYLDASIKRNGDQPLTLQHLSNLIGLILQEDDALEEQKRKSWEEAQNDMYSFGMLD